jgi:hypothetical protein
MRGRLVAAGVLALWTLVSLAHLTRLADRAEMPPGQDLLAFLAFAEQAIPTDAGYLYVQPGEFGADTGDGPRLRYELYPRRYEDVRASEDEVSVRELLRREGLGFIVVPDAATFPATHWLQQPRDWLRRLELDGKRYVLAVVDGA